MMTYDEIFDRLIGNEGGYVNNPDDPGGETNWGITWPVLHQAINMGIVEQATTIANLTRDQSKEIYRQLFWNKAKLFQLSPALAFQVFDFAVNSGIETAVRKLQHIVGVPEDGVIGQLTLAQISRYKTEVLLTRYIAERLDFWRSLSKWSAFGKSWAGRAAMNLRYAAHDLEQQ